MAMPFDGAAPAGDDLRLDATPQSLYFRLRDARAEARAEERTADNDPALGGALSAQWKIVQDLATEALLSRAKDVEIAAWLAESLTRREGLEGFAEAATIITALIARFWDDGLFPPWDADDPEARLIAISGLSGQDRDGSLLQPLRKTVLFEREDGTPITFWEYERSRDVAALLASGQKPQRAASVPAFADLEISAQGHGRAALAALGRQLAHAQEAWKGLEEEIARVTTGDETPATGRVTTLLDAMRRVVERYVPASEFTASEVPQSAEADAASADANGPEAEPAVLVPRPATRDSMLDQILQIAEAFRRTEPNSPLSYTLEDAVRRARLSWPELLRELLPDLPPRASILSGLGIRPPTE
jgi:type VI secretion system protein ImpA